MINRLAFTALRMNRPSPEIDRHPLARADGGWYPGKHFDPTDILTDPGNWLVWKQFLIFFFSMIGLPIATFLGIEMVLRTQFKMHVNQSTTVAALASMIVLQALVFTYVRLAAIEHTQDMAAAKAQAEAQAQEGIAGAEEAAHGEPSEVVGAEAQEGTPGAAEVLDDVPAGGDASEVVRRKVAQDDKNQETAEPEMPITTTDTVIDKEKAD